MTWREEELETSRAGAGLRGGGEAGRQGGWSKSTF